MMRVSENTGPSGLRLPVWYVAFGITILLFAISFQAPMKDLLLSWERQEYGYAYIVPFIAALMVWHRLAAHPISPQNSWIGVVWIAVGVGLFMVGELSTFRQLAHYGMVATIVGCAQCFLGTQAFRVIFPAFIYLLFAIPLPPQIYNQISLDMQLLSSTMGVLLLDLGGLPVFQDGNIIDFGGFKLQVVEACSGLRYLFPLLSFGFLVAYLLEDRMWKRAIIFLSAIPITIIMNSLRIALIGVTVDQWGMRMAEGLLHDFEGFSVFVVCVALMLAEVALLARVGRGRGRFHWDFFMIPRGRLFMTRPHLSLATAAGAGLSVLVTLVSATGALTEREMVVPSHVSLDQFPMTLGEWRGRRDAFSSNILDALTLNDYVIADYSKATEATSPVNFYIAYYQTQRMGEAAHSPSTCIPGGGWHIEDNSVRTVDLIAGRPPLRFARLLIQRGDVKQLVYYWFSERGRDITSQWEAKWYLLIDSIIMNRTDGALIRLVTPIAQGEADNKADQRLLEFLKLSYRDIENHLPSKEINL